MTLHQADVLEYYLRNVDGVREVSVFDRTQDAVIVYRADRAALVHALAAFSFDKAETMDLVPDHTTRELNREFEDKLSWTVIRRVISKLFFPLPVITALAIYHSIKYIREGLSALLHGKLSVAVLDATAVTVSMVRGRLLDGKLRDVHAPPWRNPRGLDAQEVRRGPRRRHVAQR